MLAQWATKKKLDKIRCCLLNFNTSPVQAMVMVLKFPVACACSQAVEDVARWLDWVPAFFTWANFIWAIRSFNSFGKGSEVGKKLLPQSEGNPALWASGFKWSSNWVET